MARTNWRGPGKLVMCSAGLHICAMRDFFSEAEPTDTAVATPGAGRKVSLPKHAS
jgi:hypothetical protein